MSNANFNAVPPSGSNLVVMGVAGCGKSSLAQAIRLQMNYRFIEGDEFHDIRNVALMKAAIPLTDEDRSHWLATLGSLLAQARGDVVLTCSALKLKYRELLRTASPGLRFVFLDIDREMSHARALARAGHHFFNPELIESQFETLERPDSEAGVLCLDATRPLPELCTAVIDWIWSTATPDNMKETST